MASRLRLLFNVNDENLRKDFLRTQVAAAVGELSQSSRAQWGNMTAQQMVEHLVWALEISSGLLEVKCNLHPKLVARMKGFLFDNTPTSHEFMNPELKKGLPPNRFSTISQACHELRRQIELFIGESESEWAKLRTHPVFGQLNHGEWERTHYKHFYHHLLQFDLIEGR
jgi:hypothetical protein